MRHLLKGRDSFGFFMLLVLLGLAILLPEPGLAQQPSPRKAPVRKAPAKTGATNSAHSFPRPAQVQGYWEPVNYTEDLQLTDIFCVSVEVCYVSGAAGTILKTTDSGQTWTPQLGGDPHSATDGFSRLHFFDETHGWARQSGGGGGLFYRTTDGETWELLGDLLAYVADYQFISRTRGFNVRQSKIFQTQDGGRNWKEVYTCQLKIEVEGLTRQVACNFVGLQFVSPLVAYAVSGEIGPKTFVVAKTEDGGATWSAWAVPDVGSPREVFFVDENVGFLWVWYNAIYRTTDGGRTWAGLVGDHGGGPIKFADPEVGWLCLGNPNFSAPSPLTYTTDGGKRWVSRSIPFPSTVNAFSLPRRDTAYVVGEHGMVYRYRVVPADEPVAANAIPAPAMPIFDSPLDEQVEQFDDQVEDFKQEVMEDAQTGEGSAAGNDEEGWAEANYGEQIENLETTLEAVSGEIPKFTGKYRNLNLLFAGVQVVGKLFGQTQGLKDAFQAFRKARDPQSALAALTELSSKAGELVQTTKTAFQKQE
jgi:photosystem II stability/assembly factor-like uncharacterized protein